MASESDTEEFFDAPEDVHLGGGYPVGFDRIDYGTVARSENDLATERAGIPDTANCISKDNPQLNLEPFYFEIGVVVPFQSLGPPPQAFPGEFVAAFLDKSPGKVVISTLKEAENSAYKVGNESPVQELKQDVSKKIIESIIEESQKVLQLEDDSLDSKGKGQSDQATASPIMAGTDLSNIPGLLAVDQVLQEDSQKAESQDVSEETELESKKCFPSDDTCDKPVDETTKSTEISSTEQQLNVPETETEVLNKEAVEVKESDVLEPASSHSLSTKDFAVVEEVAPAKPPRQLTPEPDIVASTKKPVPARPPPPTNFPPPRPPPPSRPAPPPRKKKSELEFEALKTPDLDGKY
ncbi:hypothetical protein J1605_010505 [Eschrichtius robustus]|uniref:Uncharacterized protein n=1 Tax=Eschrichtius robustus TaxID=9764 RepID=A0AB34GS25_ESCRO|nr:hypothetical protein J1605_010505 [Eschrichtius robustus]